MGIGSKVRKLFGPYERPIAGAYRRFFVDLDLFVQRLRDHIPTANRILEIGCGEGQMTERLVRLYPSAYVQAIDLIDNPGRLFRGERNRVNFSSVDLETIVQSTPASFDLVVLVDVLHHIPMGARAAFLAAAGKTVGCGGTFVLKEWARLPSLAYLLGYAADRFITGDRVVYHTIEELRSFSTTVFTGGRVIAEWRIPPWKSNACLILRRP